MSASEISCPTCATRLVLPPGNTATRFRCTQCGTVFDVVAAPPTPVPVPVPVEPPPVVVVPERPAPAAAAEYDDEPERPSRRRRRRDGDEGAEEPRRSKYSREKSKGNSGLLIAGIACVAALVIVGGVIGAYYAFRDKPKEPVKADPAPGAPPKQVPAKPTLTPDQVIRKVKTSTVYVRTFHRDGLGTGTGFFVGKPGFVVTNAHVVGYGPRELNPPVKIEVVVDSGEGAERALTATLYGLDADQDLALLRVEGKNLPPPLALGKSEELLETQEVIAFGYPFGEALGKNVSVNRTTVSSLRKLNGTVEVVQLAGGLNPGNSGGPVANGRAEVIGVSVAKLKNTETIAFAIPAETTDRFLDDQFARGGQVRLGDLSRFSTSELEGTYLTIGVESKDRTATEEQLAAVPERQRRVVIKGDQITFSSRSGDDPATIRLDSSRAPGHIDIFSTRAGRPEASYGIYKLEDDVLTICATEGGAAKDRPKAFAPGANSILLTLKKQPDR